MFEKPLCDEATIYLDYGYKIFSCDVRCYSPAVYYL